MGCWVHHEGQQTTWRIEGAHRWWWLLCAWAGGPLVPLYVWLGVGGCSAVLNKHTKLLQQSMMHKHTRLSSSGSGKLVGKLVNGGQVG